MVDEKYMDLYITLRTRLSKYALSHGLSREHLEDMTAEDVMTWLETGVSPGSLDRITALERRVNALEVANGWPVAQPPADATGAREDPDR